MFEYTRGFIDAKKDFRKIAKEKYNKNVDIIRLNCFSDWLARRSFKSTPETALPHYEWKRLIRQLKKDVGLKIRFKKGSPSFVPPGVLYYHSPAEVPHEMGHGASFKRMTPKQVKRLDQAYGIFEHDIKAPKLRRTWEALRYVVPEEARASWYAVRKTPFKGGAKRRMTVSEAESLASYLAGAV